MSPGGPASGTESPSVRNGGSADIRYAEAYQRVFPQVAGDLL